MATGTAQLKVAHIEWGTMTPLLQVADGTSTIAWEVKLVDDNGALVSGISVTFTLSAGNGAWQLSPSSGPGPRLNGTVLSTEGSRGSLRVDYTYFGKAKNSTSGQITFVGIEKVQHRIGAGAWADTPEPVIVALGTTVEFKAIPKPSDVSWPSGKPVWTGASGSGDQASQTFNTPGTNTVSAECGNTKIRHVIAFKVELTGSTSTTRGNNETYTATVTPDGLSPTFTWKFTGGGTTVQKSTGTTRTWGGVMVAGGAIEVTATIGGTETKAILNVAVNARSWNADVQAPNVDRAWVLHLSHREIWEKHRRQAYWQVI